MKQEIDYLEYDASFSRTFTQHYRYKKPCILKNCVTQWKASHWDFESLKLIRSRDEFAGNLRTVEIRDPYTQVWSRCNPNKLQKIREKLQVATLEYAPNEWLFPETHPELLAEIDIPTVLKNPQWLDQIPASNRPIYPRLLIGYEGTGSTLHIDICHTANWMAVIQGTKHWLVMPPSQENQLTNFIDAFTANTEEIVEQVYTYYEFDLQAGELLYLPEKWWHQALNATTTIAVTYNIFNIVQAFNYLFYC